jgi:hypothetical protein
MVVLSLGMLATKVLAIGISPSAATHEPPQVADIAFSAALTLANLASWIVADEFSENHAEHAHDSPSCP